jgi:hypothetical protein
MLDIHIRTIPHGSQRYNTVGDWVFFEGPSGPALDVLVSELSNHQRELLIAVHELVEAFLCEYKGITNEGVDRFDLNFDFEKGGEGEPGDDPRCPYAKPHGIASSVERLVATELGVSWSEYEAELGLLALEWKKKRE